jgi:zinc transport system permease protein
MIELFQYGFVARAFEAGLIVAIIAPLIGIFLVLRRYSLIADALSHISLAGVALGLLLNVNPLITALIASVVSSVFIERLRLSKKVYGDTALALFLSGSLALAIVIIGFAHGASVDLFSYLFGSIVTVTESNIATIAVIGIIVIASIVLFYKELVFVTFDEVGAQVSAIPTRLINTVLIMLAAVTVALSIPIVGVLLISALLIIPVTAALQFHVSFKKTIMIAECISIFSVLSGIVASYYFNTSTGATIVLIAIILFGLIYLLKRK